jgi:hypothetical protein
MRSSTNCKESLVERSFDYLESIFKPNLVPPRIKIVFCCKLIKVVADLSTS